MNRITTGLVLCALALVSIAEPARAAGTLTEAGSGAAIEIVDHQVRVLCNNGFCRTEVTQVFHNDSSTPRDAIYEFPVPQDAALSQMKIVLADRVLNGEVLPADDAQEIYDQEKAQGNQAGLATKDGHQNFRFSVANIPPSSDATMSFVYYEPISVDESVGRYLYPLQDGGTSETPWSGNTAATKLGFELELKSALAVQTVTMPGLSPQIETLGAGHYRVKLEASPADLDQDLVVNYQLPEDEPQRLDVITHRAAEDGRGTFMLIVTPGLALPPVQSGADYVFVLDVSGSMDSKMYTLIDATQKALNKLAPGDRFRLITFSDSPQDLLGGFVDASPANVEKAVGIVAGLHVLSGTNLYSAVELALSGTDSDRVTSTLLLTDAETNTGVVDPAQFDQLLRNEDVRIYGMLMSNNANWPLMEIMSEASGGFYQQVSNQDDILGQVELAFNKATHKALHDVKLGYSGTSISDTTEFRLQKIYKGQQLVLFGRYDTPETVQLTLQGKISGKPESVSHSVNLPSVRVEDAEIERLWALDMIHAIEKQNLLGLIPNAEAKARIIELGVEYQLVTDYTSMVVVDDATFEKYGVDRLNRERSAAEGSGSSGYSPGDSKFGGAIDLGHIVLAALLILGLAVLALGRRYEKRDRA